MAATMAKTHQKSAKKSPENIWQKNYYLQGVVL